MTLPKTAIELFCGVGMTRVALEQQGWKVVWSNDGDKNACSVYRYHYGERELVEQDIRTVGASSIPEATLLFAGFPCQAYSVSGSRKGFAEDRGTLFFEVARIARAKRPRIILLENVPGLLSAPAQVSTGFYTATKGEGKGEITDDNGLVENQPERGWEAVTIPVAAGYCFAEMLLALQDLGYSFTEWQVLNGEHYGPPQTRERIFIIGHLGTDADCAQEVFPFTAFGFGSDSTCKAPPESRQRLRDASAPDTRSDRIIAGTLQSRYFKDGSDILILQQHHREGGLGQGRIRIFDKGIMPTLTAQMGTGGNNCPLVVNKNGSDDKICISMELGHTKANMKAGRFTQDKTHTLDGTGGKAVLVADNPKLCGDLGLLEGNNIAVLNENINGNFYLTPKCPTLRHSKMINNVKLLEVVENNLENVRRLMPVECDRLMGLPDDYTRYGRLPDGSVVELSDTQRYRLDGNGLIPQVVMFILERLWVTNGGLK